MGGTVAAFVKVTAKFCREIISINSDDIERNYQHYSPVPEAAFELHGGVDG